MGGFESQDIQKEIVEHPRLAKARMTANKKLVIEEKYSPPFINSVSKLHTPLMSNKKVPLLLPKIEQTQAENFCGIEKTMNVYMLIYSYYKFSLFQQISRRRTMKLNFQQTELWFLLYHLVYASSIFQRKKEKSGDIRPRNVLIDEKGDIAIINTLTFPNQLTNYYKSLYNSQITFLAPQELAELEVKAKYCKSDPVISEAFSIGLTIMDAALLANSESLYNMQEISFKNYQFQEDLVSFKSLSLSPFFIKTVLNILQVQHFNRPTPGEVLAILQPYEKQILELIQFIPDKQKSRLSLVAFQNEKM